MIQASRYYQPSGVVGVVGLINMIVLGVSAAVVLGVIYGYAIFYIPFIYVSFVITLGFGAGVGYAVGLGGRLGKVRNAKVGYILGFLAGCLAEYIGWVSWLLAASDQEVLILNPKVMLDAIQMVAAEGAWSIFNWTPSGILLYLIWTVEAMMIIGVCTFLAGSMLSAKPFCESCNQWIKDKMTIAPLTPIGEPDHLKGLLEQRDFSALTALQKQPNGQTNSTTIDLVHCPICQRSHFLTVTSVEITDDSGKKEQTQQNVIVKNLILSAEEFEMLKNQWA
ncbi:MAG: hypothetical protein JW709_05620 [Sedimentisphaerales bacterium]|nr:hypothetical protein [Sedimentisphaerales bacterium]